MYRYSLEDNMNAGRSAIHYVKSLGIETNDEISRSNINYYDDIRNKCVNKEINDNDFCIDIIGKYKQYYKVEFCVEDLRKETFCKEDGTCSKQDVSLYLDRIYHKVLARRCGLCGELSAVAFRFLMDCVRPIDYMTGTFISHSFLLIGREYNSDETDYLTWGDNCVVCDPWHKGGEVYLAVDAYKRMFDISFYFSPYSKYRLD